MITRPMLAGTPSVLENIQFPVLASAKLDGIRCVIIGGKALTRKFKELPNRYVRQWLETNLPDGMDGELLTFNADGTCKSFNEIQSDIMSFEGEPNFQFWAFDYVNPEFGGLENGYQHRYINLAGTIGQLAEEVRKRLKLVNHLLLCDWEELLIFERKCLAEKQEGVMIRSLNGPYKCGRSTEREGYLLKIKRRIDEAGKMVDKLDSEAVVIGFEELMTNTNPKEINELGLSKRSSKKEGKVPAGKLGKFLVRDIHTDEEFKVGTGDGLTLEMRKEIWDNQENYLGKIFKYEYEPFGVKDKPRFPVWIGWRDERDIS